MRAGIVSVLGNRTYRRLFGAQVIALVGTGLLTVALGLLAFELSGAAAGAVLGTALAIKMVAYVGVAPVIAALVHRLPAKAVLVGADLMRLAMAASLPFVTEVWQIYALIFLLQAASATFTPTFQSLIPSVLPAPDDYTRALSLSRIAYDLEAILSPVLAAALLVIVPFSALFAGTAFGFAGSAVLLLVAAVPRVASTESSTFWQRLAGGARTFLRTPSLRFVLVANVVVATGVALVLVNTVVLVKDRAGAEDAAVALALAVFGAGSVVAALAVPRAVARWSVPAVMQTGAVIVSGGLAGGVAAALAPAGSGAAWWGMLAAWLVLGVGTSLIATPTGRLLAEAANPENRSLVFAAQFALSHACYLVTYPIAGWVGAGDVAASAAVLGGVAAGATLALLLIGGSGPTPKRRARVTEAGASVRRRRASSRPR
ncbi:MFS transporter [Microbacterium sp. ABRD28]|uniref:MFS transporter n=1 Tax=Microbacterium sp. ABRD28 TaxID=2268461 RepID=UPI00197C4E1E|nr:MFS transporter [Microbacterium sp. ABRD28]